jgi:hypothetical protein
MRTHETFKGWKGGREEARKGGRNGGKEGPGTEQEAGDVEKLGSPSVSRARGLFFKNPARPIMPGRCREMTASFFK